MALKNSFRRVMSLLVVVSKMEGVIDLAEHVLQAPIRQGIPQHIQGVNEIVSNPAYATAVGY